MAELEHHEQRRFVSPSSLARADRKTIKALVIWSPAYAMRRSLLPMQLLD